MSGPYNHRLDPTRRSGAEDKLRKTLSGWGVRPAAAPAAAEAVLREVLAEFRPDFSTLARQTGLFVTGPELGAILGGLRLLGPGSGLLPAAHWAGLIRYLTPWRRPSNKGVL